MSKHRAHRPVRHGHVLAVSAVLTAAAAATSLQGVAIAAPTAAAPAGQLPGAPCAKEVKACVSLSSNQAWLTDGRGAVVRGPIRINHGAPGKDTPTGRFAVQWKDADHRSGEANGAPMPWSVFFDGNGRAFHGGNPGRPTAGCVRLPDDEAKAFFDALVPGDAVEILP